MKKIIASAVGLMLAGGIATTASAAIENQFGGYWRSRFVFEDNFNGTDTASKFYVDQRTRLFYTAKFSDDFKFVNKFEFNSSWGDTTAKQTAKVQTGTIFNADGSTTPVYTNYDVSGSGLGAGGDAGADGKGNLRIKNSYADFNLGSAVNAKVGILPATVARGFIFDDDASGAVATLKFGNVSIPLVYLDLADTDAAAWDVATAAKADQRVYAALAAVKINDNITVTPYFVYHTIDQEETQYLVDHVDNYYAGVDADMKFGGVTAWFTGIYEGGTVEVYRGQGVDLAAYLGAVGVDAAVSSTVSIHGQAFYASGDDNANDDEFNTFISAPGALTLNNNAPATPNVTGFTLSSKSGGYGSSYYWAEIMGLGVFDNSVSSGSPGDDITNIMAGNVGVTLKPIDKMKVSADVWYASLVEKAPTAKGDEELGTEFDVNVGYNIYDNLTAEAIFAYLLSGDATGNEDVMEGGVRLSLKF